MNPMGSVRRALLALGLCWLAACAGSGAREGEWSEAEVVIASERVLRQAAVIALERNGFLPGTEEVGAQSTVTSGWKVELQPFKGEGRRRKAHFEYEELEPSKWRVFVRVEKETNEELSKPLDLSRAKWASAPDDAEASSRILRYFLSVFAEKGSDQPRRPPVEAG